MNALTIIAPERLSFDRFLVHPVEGSGMEPDLRGGKDSVVLASVNGYCHEGIYLLDWGVGPVLYRAYGCGGGKIRIKLDNPAFGGATYDFSKEDFNSMCIGFVVADIRVRDEYMMRKVMEAGR